MTDVSAEDKAIFAPLAGFWLMQFATCPAEAKQKMDERVKEEREAEFAATWGASDTDGDDLLSKAEWVDFTTKMSANNMANYGWTPEMPTDKCEELWDVMHGLEAADAAGVSKATFGRYYAVFKNIAAGV